MGIQNHLGRVLVSTVAKRGEERGGEGRKGKGRGGEGRVGEKEWGGCDMNEKSCDMCMYIGE